MSHRPQSSEELLTQLEKDEIEYLWVTYHDYSGIGCAKSIPRPGFASAVREGIVFAKANLDMDILDYQPGTATMLANSGDFLAVPDPLSYVKHPRHSNTAEVHAWMRDSDGSSWSGCPRTILNRTISSLSDAGYSVRCAFEPEFYLLDQQGDGDFAPTNQARMYTQSGLQEERQFVESIVDDLRFMEIDVVQVGKEYARGQYELSIRHGSPLKALDQYWYVRDVVRNNARNQGHIATFMPKPYETWAGNSLHVHMSVWDQRTGQDVTASLDDDTSLSDQGRWFLGGLLAHAPALTGLGCPTVNSYKRLLPGSWAPANIYWGVGNRSGVARIPGGGMRRRIEFRAGDNSCNAALYLTGLLAAGLDGLTRKLDPGPPFQGDVGRLGQKEMETLGLTFLPRTLEEALSALETDEVIATAIGDGILPHFLSIKRSELNAYSTVVHRWERDTYLEVI